MLAGRFEAARGQGVLALVTVALAESSAGASENASTTGGACPYTITVAELVPMSFVASRRYSVSAWGGGVTIRLPKGRVREASSLSPTRSFTSAFRSVSWIHCPSPPRT